MKQNDSNVSNDSNGSHVSNDSKVNIFILIDALGWNYIKDRPFLNDICSYRQKVKTILGYSCGVIPCILTGKSPVEHKKFSLFYYNSKTSPFGWTKCFLWLPDKILESRLSRKIVEVISKYIYRYKGYFETYVVPVKYLHLFDMPEKENAYNEGAFRCIKSVFDVWREKNIPYKKYYYNLSDEQIFQDTLKSLKSSEPFKRYFLYLSDFDHFLHYHCKDKEKVNEKIDWYEEKIRALYEAARSTYDAVRITIFSDHGMVPIERYYDLRGEIETVLSRPSSLVLRPSEDYVAMYDATMARFYFFNDDARKKIVELLEGKDYGEILSKERLQRLGIDYSDNKYGEVIFLMKQGSVINPSFMGSKKVEGMHGFDPGDAWMDASFLSNYEPEIEIKDIRDFFTVMSEL